MLLAIISDGRVISILTLNTAVVRGPSSPHVVVTVEMLTGMTPVNDQNILARLKNVDVSDIMDVSPTFINLCF